MAKLPNGESARIPVEKLIDYCLNPAQPRGKDKAHVFASVLGLTRDKLMHWPTLFGKLRLSAMSQKKKKLSSGGITE